MREWIVRAVNNREAVCALLGQIDVNTLSRGQLLLTPVMLENVLKLFSDKKLELYGVSMEAPGSVGVSVKTGGMTLRYCFRLMTAVASGGRLILRAGYTEEKLSGGIGSAVMNLSGKSGLALALGKRPGIRVDGSNIEMNVRGIPEFINASFLRFTPGGIVVSVD